MNQHTKRGWVNFQRSTAAGLLLACAGLAVAAGTVDRAAERARLQLRQLPQKPQQVLDVQRQLVAAKKTPGAVQSQEVVVIGRIGGMPNLWADTHPDFPWYGGQASFFLVDSKIAAQFATHAAQHGGNHNCAFCQSLAAKNAHAAAVVNFVDERGAILPIDTRELLSLQENQTIIVRGKAKLLSGTLLVIDADGVYVVPMN